MKPERSEVAQSVALMAAVIDFFPKTELALEIIIGQLCEFVGSLQGLDWLTSTAIRVMPKYSGVAGLRALYCTRFKPCDGLPETACEIPGFTPAEAMDAAERAYFEREAVETDRKLIEWKREFEENQLLEAGSQPKQLSAPEPLRTVAEMPTYKPSPPMLRPRPEDLKAARDFDDKINPKEQTSGSEYIPGEEPPKKPSTRELEAEIKQAPRSFRTPEENERLVRELEAQLKSKTG